MAELTKNERVILRVCASAQFKAKAAAYFNRIRKDERLWK